MDHLFYVFFLNLYLLLYLTVFTIQYISVTRAPSDLLSLDYIENIIITSPYVRPTYDKLE